MKKTNQEIPRDARDDGRVVTAMLLLSVLFVMLFLRLGFWQLARGHEKQSMLDRAAVQAKAQVVNWDAHYIPSQYQPLRVSGKFLNTRFFWDNQHYNHQFGYHIISPLALETGGVILIDRGWVAGDSTRVTLPDIMVPHDQVTLVGHAYFPSKKTWLLGEAIEFKSNEQIIVELIDPEIISHVLHQSVYPFIIRLDKQSPHGFIREWMITSGSPDRHYAYAVQWFGLAAVILFLSVFFWIKTRGKKIS